MPDLFSPAWWAWHSFQPSDCRSDGRRTSVQNPDVLLLLLHIHGHDAASGVARPLMITIHRPTVGSSSWRQEAVEDRAKISCRCRDIPAQLLLLLLMAMASNGHEGFTHEGEGQGKKTINLVSDHHGIIL
uniref:Pyruvate dehydrogenase E1 component subunit beta n=1 Tax=Oryza punctata TaxID=4537 RepID=A0A0E0MPN0_ORYPU